MICKFYKGSTLITAKNLGVLPTIGMKVEFHHDIYTIHDIVLNLDMTTYIIELI